MRQEYDADLKPYRERGAFAMQWSWDVIQFSYIDKTVSHEESHANGGHDRASVVGCPLCAAPSGHSHDRSDPQGETHTHDSGAVRHQHSDPTREDFAQPHITRGEEAE